MNNTNYPAHRLQKEVKWLKQNHDGGYTITYLEDVQKGDYIALKHGGRVYRIQAITNKAIYLRMTGTNLVYKNKLRNSFYLVYSQKYGF